jgi:hypothetical protein
MRVQREFQRRDLPGFRPLRTHALQAPHFVLQPFIDEGTRWAQEQDPIPPRLILLRCKFFGFKTLEATMKKFSLAILTIASLAGTAGTAFAQTYYYDDGDGYYVDPSPYYGPRYRDRYFYDDDRYERRIYRDRYRQWNGCPRHYTVQDGVCKPYRGY